MALNVDRIEALAEDDTIELPPITVAQAVATLHLMGPPLTRSRRLPAG